MKSINTSLFDFPGLIENGCVYVDKTAQIYELAKRNADRIYFLPRPRRFGKSLLLSTLKALFQGRRELFKGLAIEKTDWDWDREVYPVLHLDMSVVRDQTAERLERNLFNLVENKCIEHKQPFDKNASAAMNLYSLLCNLHRESPDGKIVILIDEYDAPISCMLDTEEKLRELPKVREVLHNFYVQAKACSCDTRFMMVTGVSRFAKTSIFSAFNNPTDLMFDRRTPDLLGYTHEEMETYFHEHIQAFADARGETYNQAFNELLAWYDSYQFSPYRLVKVINPVSLGKALNACAISNYWEATGGATLIYSALKAINKAPEDMACVMRTITLDAADALTVPVGALLYQGGYLTIDKRLDDFRLLLKIPNLEVRSSLQRGYISFILGRDFQLDNFQDDAEDAARDCIANGLTPVFTSLLKSAYTRLPHDWVCKDETEAKRLFLAFMTFARADVAGEPQHATGRPDAVLRTEKAIYIFEFKYNATAAAAIEQCRQRNYAERFEGDGLPVFYVGVNYNPADNVRSIDGVVCEPA